MLMVIVYKNGKEVTRGISLGGKHYTEKKP